MTFFVTGTDTDVGKTIVSAWLMLHLDAAYWKPVQCGFEPRTDAQTVKMLTECTPERILPTKYMLEAPLSPHEAARRENVHIELDALSLPEHQGPVIVEGAGGLLVPLNDTQFIIDLIAHLNITLILTCRSTLGTLNHTLLSLEAIRKRNLKIAGLVMVGPERPENYSALEEYGGIPILGELPVLTSLNKETLISHKPKFDLNIQSAQHQDADILSTSLPRE